MAGKRPDRFCLWAVLVCNGEFCNFFFFLFVTVASLKWLNKLWHRVDRHELTKTADNQDVEVNVKCCWCHTLTSRVQLIFAECVGVCFVFFLFLDFRFTALYPQIMTWPEEEGDRNCCLLSSKWTHCLWAKTHFWIADFKTVIFIGIWSFL